MKQTKIALFIFAACAVVLSACKKDSTTKSQYSVTATINGKTETTTNVQAVNYVNENSFEVLAQFSSTEDVSFLITAVKTGSYDVGANATEATYTNGSDAYTGTSGTVKLSTYGSGTASGTFNFVATDSNNNTVTITSGTFNTTYSTYTSE